MKTTLKYRELSAGEITESALTELRYRGFEVWRQHDQYRGRGRSFRGRKGLPDIIGFTTRGTYACFVGCEVKTVKDKLSSDQIEFLSGLMNAGGLVYIATQRGSQVTLINFKDYTP